MIAHVLLRDPDGREHELVPGDVIGRVWSSALQVDDGRVSEAHAMVSLREGQVTLIPLRGGLAVDGRPLPQVPLVPGLRVQLARDLELEVVEVNLPGEILGVEGPNLPRQALPAVCSFVVDPPIPGGPPPGPRVVRGWRSDAPLRVWTRGDRWMARDQDGTRELDAGVVLTVAGVPLRFVAIPLKDAGPRTTRRHGDLEAPVRIVALFDTVHLHREGAPPLALCGLQARLISELVACDGPISWSALSEELWPQEPDPVLRRGRLDTLLSRLRRRIRAAGFRADLIRSDHAGCVELLLYANDRVEDRT